MPKFLIKESHVDVLIIGAGPTGLFCANGLAKAGITTRIVDIRPETVSAGHADGIQPRTLEVLQSYGLADKLLREGTQIHTVALWNPAPNGDITSGGKSANITASDARYPFETTMHQGNIESIFVESLAAIGLQVNRPVKPTSLEVSTDSAELIDTTSYPVKVVLKHLGAADDQEIVRAKFVVGADGAHSWVRKSLGITMEGEQTDSLWASLDVRLETNFPDIRSKCLIHSGHGICGIVPREDDMVRMYIQLYEGSVGVDVNGKFDKTQLMPEQLFEIAEKSFMPYNIAVNDCVWWGVYTGQRVASRYSAHGRVLIAGDACHTHSPKAGQGMNASMCDSHNLIWKLVYVLRGWANMSLLETYEDERRRYAQDLIDFDKMFSKLVETKPSQTDIEQATAHAQMLSALQQFGEFTSGVGVRYGPSLIVDTANQSLASKVIVGKRMPPRIFTRASDGRPFEIQDLLPADTRFKLLVFAGNTNEEVQFQRVSALASYLDEPDGFFHRIGGREPNKVFSLLVIGCVSVSTIDFMALIRVFRTHWSQIFVDDMPMYDHHDAVGQGYDAYGIDRTEGAVLVIRPDGYVGKVASIDGFLELAGYFSGFMKA